MSGQRDLSIKIGTEGDTSGAEAVVDAMENVTEAAAEANGALAPDVPSTSDTEDRSAETTRQTTIATEEAAKATEHLTAEEKRLLDVKSQFMTAAEAQVAEVQRLVEAAQREAKAQDAATIATEKASDALDESTLSAQSSAKSLDQLEENLKRLQRQLLTAPVGSKEFAALAVQTREAQKELTIAEEKARKLGGTLGRTGNGGMAVLEFSRLLEDSQYGIRGVLNNIPGLVTMLGGGAGLAGVISILAVGATQLWERLGNNESATTAVDNYKKKLEETKAVFDELEKLSQKQRDDESKKAADSLKGRLGSIDLKYSLEDQGDSAARLKIQAEARLAIAKEKLEMFRVEGEMVGATGEKAIKLAERRSAIIENIRKIEASVTEEMRRQDEIAAKRGVDKASEKVEEASKAVAAKEEIAKPLRDELQRLEEQRSETVKRLMEAEEKLRQKVEESSERYQEALDSGVGAYFAPPSADLVGAVEEQKLKKQIEEIKGEIARVDAELNAKEPGVEKANNETKTASDALKQFTDELTKAKSALEQVQNINEIGRNTDREMDGIRSQRETEQRNRESQSRAISNLGELANQFENSPELAPVAKAINQALSDKALSSEEILDIEAKFQAYRRQISELGRAVENNVGAATDELRSLRIAIDENTRDLRKLKASAGKHNP